MFKRAFIKTLPVMAGYIVLGIGFGILAKVNGLNILWVFLMSLFIYAGSMQFVGISLITGGATLITTAITTLLVNARHLFYSISMLDKYRGSGFKKPYLIFGLTDETYSLVCNDDAEEGFDKHKFYFLITILDQFYWVTGSLIGAVLGGIITFNTAGIDFAMTALFVTVFVEQWKSTKEHRPALIGLGATALCLIIFGSENFLIPSMALIAVLLTVLRPFLTKKEAENE